MTTAKKGLHCILKETKGFKGLKVGLRPSKKVSVTCFSEKPLKLMKSTFYFILKALFIPNIFKFKS